MHLRIFELSKVLTHLAELAKASGSFMRN